MAHDDSSIDEEFDNDESDFSSITESFSYTDTQSKLK